MDHQALACAQSLHALQQISYAQEAALLQAKHFPPLLRTLEQLMVSEEVFLGAFAENILVGAISTEHDTQGDLIIASLVVHPAQQRQGIARALLRATLQSARTKPIHVATGARNTPVLRLYASLGFIEKKRWMVGEEALELVALTRAPSPA
jgi:GNAT superfamily N-acetyltransferase